MTLPEKKSGPFASLGIRNFRLLLFGTVLSNATQWIQQVTLSWLVYDMTGSGTILGSINLVRSIASLGMIPVAGILIDRINRRNLMLLTNGWLLIITLGLGLLLVFGRSNVYYLFIFAFLGGMTQTIDYTLRQVVLFDLVPRSITPNAVALIQTGWSLMRSFGPSIGGFLLVWFGAGGNFLFQAGIYALIAINIMYIHFPPRKPDAVRSSPIQNIKDGLRYIVERPITRSFMLMGFILPLFIIPIYTVLPPIYAADVFHGGPEILGFLLSSVGIGGIVGGIAMAYMSRFERRGLLQLISLFLLSLSLIGFGFSTKLSTALPLLALSGFFEMAFLTTNQTLLQLSIPDNLRGRVTSVVNLNNALFPLGGLIAGTGSDLLGGPKMITIILGAITAGIAVIIFFSSSKIRNYRLSQAIESPPAW
jgi:predicted MFS family arabinose efflux permease